MGSARSDCLNEYHVVKAVDGIIDEASNLLERYSLRLSSTGTCSLISWLLLYSFRGMTDCMMRHLLKASQ